MKGKILATIALFVFSAPVYAQEFDEDDFSYEARRRVEKARRRVDEAQRQVEVCSKVAKLNRDHYTGGGDPFSTYFYNKMTGNKDSDCQNEIALYKAALQNYQLELEMAIAEKEYQNVRRRR